MTAIVEIDSSDVDYPPKESFLFKGIQKVAANEITAVLNKHLGHVRQWKVVSDNYKLKKITVKVNGITYPIPIW